MAPHYNTLLRVDPNDRSGTKVVPDLAESLETGDDYVRREAAWALGEIGPEVVTDPAALTTIDDRAVLLLGVGFSRVFWGAKGAPFYLSNPLFWTKIGLFMTVAMLSIPPTIQLIRWSKHAHSHRDFRPPDEQVRRIQRWLYAEWMVVTFIPFLAAAIARGIGLS